MSLQTLGPILLGSLILVVGSLFKVFLEYDQIRPGAPVQARGRILFRQLYLAPDFLLLSFGLLVSAQSLQSFLSNHRITSRLGDTFGFWFWSLILYNILALVICVFLWMFAGQAKYIPIGAAKRRVHSPSGEIREVTIQTPLWLAGLFSREGLLTLVCGNLVGLTSLLTFLVFISSAF